MKKITRILPFLAACLLTPLVSSAADKSASMVSKATLSSACTLSATDVVFGDYDPTAAAHQLTTNTVTILCNRTTAWNYYAYAGYSNPSSMSSYGTGYVSTMANGTYKLYYQVQMSDGQWDNDIDFPTSVNKGHYLGTGTGTAQTLTINYRAIKGQFVAPGNYKDTVAAYIAF